MSSNQNHGIGDADESLMPNHHLSAAAKVPAAGRWRMGVISNPTSGSNRKKFSQIRRYIAEQGDLPHKIVTNAGDVVRAIEELARQDVNLIVVNAGDGTIHAVLTTLFHHRPYQTLPLLALLRGGTTNMTPKDLGLRGSRIQSLARILSWSQSGGSEGFIVRRPILRLQHPTIRLPLYGLFFGAASISKGINLFHKRIHGTGLEGNPANALILARFLMAIAARDLNELGAARATITVDGNTLPAEHFILILTYTLERLIFGMQPHWGTEDGVLRLTAAAATSRHFLRVMAAMCQGRRSRLAIPPNGFYSHNAHEVRMVLNGSFTLDGELFEVDAHQGELVLDAGGQAAFLQLSR